MNCFLKYRPRLLRHQTSNAAITQYSLRSCITGVTKPVLCDVSTGNRRPFEPEEFRRAIFDSLYGLSHPENKSFTEADSISFHFDPK